MTFQFGRNFGFGNDDKMTGHDSQNSTGIWATSNQSSVLLVMEYEDVGANITDIFSEFDISLAVNLLRVFIAIIGVLANVVLFIVFLYFPIFNVPSNQFILSLAVNDVMSLAYDVIFIFMYYVAPAVLGKIPCMVGSLGILFVVINLCQLAAIAVERFLFIRRPLHYYALIANWKSLLIFGSWIVPSVVFAPLVFCLQCEQMGPGPLFMAIFGSYLFVGFLLIACLYFFVFRSAHEQMNNMIASYPHVEDSHEISHNVKLLRGYFVIVGSAFITYFAPISIFIAYAIKPSLLPILMQARHLAAILATVNNSLNPVVYFFCQRTFKDCVTKLGQKVRKVQVRLEAESPNGINTCYNSCNTNECMELTEAYTRRRSQDES
ncbi:adrenocorticotropic hormone receptor-like isoform X2 [Symsagittifera roscoffensis]|uniref:adrenocorticotropic hormone receptor-like isoform X2 n=1 Tax=Symsagittifera roscoffensis TaxID=84072 RepID=UPI00307B5058